MMTDHTGSYQELQGRQSHDDSDRALLDQLLEDARLYKGSRDYKELLEFVVKLRNFAPFNAMLLQIQKPGLSYALSARERLAHGRKPKEAARPLLILWPFGPVALVYDVQDTEGQPLPRDTWNFVAQGSLRETQFALYEQRLKRKNIECLWVDAGDRRAGLIRVVRRATSEKDANQYRIHLNQNHDTAVQFTTLAHELGHLCLGHLGGDKKLKIPQRPTRSHPQMELEAESVAYIVCHRQGISPRSQTYLSNFVEANTTTDHLDIYQIMRAAGQVEALLGFSDHGRSH